MANANAEKAPVRVWLGNRAPIEIIDGERRKINVPKACTFYAPQPENVLDQTLEVRSMWPHVSDDPAPKWVASTSAKLAESISDAFGGIEIREPEDPDVVHGPYKVVQPKQED